MSGMTALWLTVLVVLLPTAQWHPHDYFFSQSEDHQHVTIEARHVATLSSLPPSTGGEKLFPYTMVIALPPMVGLSLSARSSNEEGQSLVWLLGATARPRAPPSLKL
jgi:hypothetical protein